MQYEKLFDNLRSMLVPDKNLVQERAYFLWKKAGSPVDGNFWYEAEKQILNEMTSQIIQKVIRPNLQETAVEITDLLKNNTVNMVKTSASLVEKNIQGEVLPEGVRFLRKISENDYWVVVEDSPKIRTLCISMKYHRPRMGAFNYDNLHPSNAGSPEYIRIALPYVIYTMRIRHGTISGFHCYFRNSPLKTIKDAVFQMYLPNVGRTGEPCVPWGSMKNFVDLSLSDKIKTAIAFFWQTNFNYFLSDPTPTSDQVHNYDVWAKNTIENPLFVLNVNWRRSPTELINLMPSVELDNTSLVSDVNRLIHAASKVLQLELPKVTQKV
jgi:hypothetical protein